MIEHRDNGDLIIFATNGDPLVKFEAEGGPFLSVNINHRRGTGFDDHPLNVRAEQLDREAVDAIREWCDRALPVPDELATVGSPTQEKEGH